MAPARGIFVHGAGASPDVWVRQRRAFPEALRISLDTPRDLDGDMLLDRFADAILTARTGPLWLVGHSMGGAAALIAAQRAPDRVQGLILVGSGRRLPVNPALLEALDANPDEAKARIARWSLAKTADPRLAAENERLMATQDAHVLRRQFAACATFSLPPDAIPASVPLGAVVGAEDRMTPPDLVAELSSWRPGAPVFTIPGAGHLVMLESPDVFNATIRQMLDAWGLS